MNYYPRPGEIPPPTFPVGESPNVGEWRARLGVGFPDGVTIFPLTLNMVSDAIIRETNRGTQRLPYVEPTEHSLFAHYKVFGFDERTLTMDSIHVARTVLGVVHRPARAIVRHELYRPTTRRPHDYHGQDDEGREQPF